ncbi:polyketide cyclase [Streptomyces sp. MMG1533]|uniref:SRPBCC family protein n=1 Tax=Streptomyces sp. MMG1533 TaxID=1415546 RepID=UPI0006AE2D38|nr:SRPBCC family protein [Streptomyces sp. MMG1533]KOU63477.1 polyketide cyclase [Streptomyces sp. MMG1533]
MRYAEGPRVCCDVHIAADPSRVWALVTDIGLSARLSPELQRVEWLDGAEEPAVGARFAGYNRHRMAGEWWTVSYVVRLEERRVFGWAVTDPEGRYGDPAPDPAKPLATWRYELAPEGPGTRLRQLARIGPGRSGLNLVIDRTPEREEQIVAFRLAELRTNMEATLYGIKALAEEADRGLSG